LLTIHQDKDEGRDQGKQNLLSLEIYKKKVSRGVKGEFYEEFGPRK